jgi:hypothetical protein
MPAEFVRSITSWAQVGLLPENDVVNVMHWQCDSETTGTLNNLADRIHTFYHDLDGNFASVMSSQLTVQLYDMEDPTPRVPIYEEQYTDMGPGATSLPQEVALCLSFQADVESGQSQARRRGRIYLGSRASTMNETVSGRTRPIAALRTAITDAAPDLCVSGTAGDYRLAVFSPTIYAATADYDEAFNDVTNGWVDDAWDTQRRRGEAPTARTTFTV